MKLGEVLVKEGLITKEHLMLALDMKKAYYRGPVLKAPGNEELIKILSGTPHDSLTIPVSIRGRAVALLYADNGVDSVLDANVNYLNTLVSMASMAFEILILRKKIMDR